RLYTSNQVVVGGSTDAAGLFQKPSGIFAAQVPGASTAVAPAVTPHRPPPPPGPHPPPFFRLSHPTLHNTFPLRFQEVDQNGNVVPGSQKPAPGQLAQFDPSVVIVCVPLGPGQTPVSETWELIQLSTENHNFHLHQTRFVMTGSNGGVIQDNFPLGVA